LEFQVSYGLLHRWTESSRSSVVRTSRSRRRVFGLAEIERGWLVVDVDGRRVGTVKGREGDFLAVSRGLARSPLYVPLTAVREVREGTVTLSLTAIAIGESRWSEKPRPTSRQPGSKTRRS
jgi:hypothetical protein